MGVERTLDGGLDLHQGHGRRDSARVDYVEGLAIEIGSGTAASVRSVVEELVRIIVRLR